MLIEKVLQQIFHTTTLMIEMTKHPTLVDPYSSERGHKGIYGLFDLNKYELVDGWSQDEVSM